MELILATLGLLLVALIVVRDAHPTTPGSEMKPHEPPAPVAPSVAVADPPQAEAAPARDILPGAPVGREAAADDIEEIVVDAIIPPAVGIPVLRPDPARFFQHELLEPIRRGRSAAVVRLLIVVVTCGIGAGVLLVLIGRAIGILIRRASGV